MKTFNEEICWHSVSDKLPCSDATVLVRTLDESSDPVWLGYLSRGQWRHADGWPLDDVIFWADMPGGPVA
jgi:hypothetical protein